MIDKEKIRVGLRFAMGTGIYEIVSINKKGIAEIEVIISLVAIKGATSTLHTKLIQEFCDPIKTETPEQKGRRETDYADKVIQDIEQFELDNIEYLRDKIQEKIDRIR